MSFLLVCFLPLDFCNFTRTGLGVVCLTFILLWVCSIYWNYGLMSFYQFWKILDHYQDFCFCPIILLFLFWDSSSCTLNLFTVCRTSLCCIFHHFCFLYWKYFSTYFYWPIFQFTNPLFRGTQSSVNPPTEFLISVIVFFSYWISSWLFLIDSNSLVKFSICYIFLNISITVVLTSTADDTKIWVTFGSISIGYFFFILVPLIGVSGLKQFFKIECQTSCMRNWRWSSCC